MSYNAQDRPHNKTCCLEFFQAHKSESGSHTSLLSPPRIMGQVDCPMVAMVEKPCIRVMQNSHSENTKHKSIPKPKQAKVCLEFGPCMLD